MPSNSNASSDSMERWTRLQFASEHLDRTSHPQFGARTLAAALMAVLFISFWTAGLLPSRVAPFLLMLCGLEIISYPVYLYFYSRFSNRLFQFYCHWVTDIIIFTFGIHWLGGVQAFLFSFLYCLVILSSSIIARRRDSFFLATLSTFCFGGMLFLESIGTIHSHRIWSFDLSGKEQIFFPISCVVFFFLVAHFASLFAERIRERGRILEMMNAITRVSSSSLALQGILDRVLSFALDHLRADFGFIRLNNNWPERQDKDLETRQFPQGFDEEKDHSEEQLLELLANKSGPLIIEDFTADSRSQHLNIPWIGSMIAAPIIHKGESVGSFLLFVKKALKGLPKRHFFEKDLNLLVIITQQISPAIVNARLYTNLEESNRNLRKAQDNIVKVEKFGALEEMITGLGHQFRNPLLAIGAAAKRMAKGNRIPDEMKFYLQIMQKETEKLEKILKDVPGFNIGKECNRQEFDVNALIERTVSLVFENEDNKGILIERDYTMLKDPLPSIDRDQFEVALYNIFCNAREAMGEDGTLKIKTSLESGIESRVLQIEISDTGGGISPEQVENIFNPFYTTKHTGAGLGLTMTYRIVENHGGDIRVLNRPGEGVTFQISIPNA